LEIPPKFAGSAIIQKSRKDKDYSRSLARRQGMAEDVRYYASGCATTPREKRIGTSNPKMSRWQGTAWT